MLERPPLSRLPDRALRWGLSALAVALLALLVYFFVRLIGQSNPSLSHNGLSFVFGNDWDVSRGIYHAAPMLVGTLITSTLALIIGVPVAVAAALFLTELCPGGRVARCRS